MLTAAVSLFLSQDPVVTKGLSCLKSIIEDVKNTYTTALLAYTFSLAGDTDTRQQLFKKLEDVALSEGKRFVSGEFLLSFHARWVPVVSFVHVS